MISKRDTLEKKRLWVSRPFPQFVWAGRQKKVSPEQESVGMFGISLQTRHCLTIYKKISSVLSGILNVRVWRCRTCFCTVFSRENGWLGKQNTLVSKCRDGGFPDYLRNSTNWFGRKPLREEKQHTADWVSTLCLIPLPEVGILSTHAPALSGSPGLYCFSMPF